MPGRPGDQGEHRGPGPAGQRVLAHEEGQEQGEEPGQQARPRGQPQHVAHRARQRAQPPGAAAGRRQRQRALTGARAVEVELARGGVDPGGQPDRHHRRGDVHRERQPQRPVRADLGQPPGEPAADRHPDQPGDGEAGVGGDQADAVRQQAWHRRGARHGVRTARDEAAQRRREEPRAVLHDGRGEHPGEERARREGGAERPAAAVPEPVEQRPDQRCQQHEGRHGEHEEQRHPPAGLVGGQREDGARERDRERGIPGDVDRVQLGEPRQAGVGGAVGVGEAAEPATGRRATSADHPDAGAPAPPRRAPRCGRRR